jgi:coenzyme F420-0:L-glutamate ligase/coenzyme F420-1:gamma-L-glutamate ligase
MAATTPMTEQRRNTFISRFVSPQRLELSAVAGLPIIKPGDDIAGLIAIALAGAGFTANDDDVIVVAQKIVSKSENRFVRLDDVVPGDAALGLAGETGKDARIVELILRESACVVRHARDVIVVEHKQGFVMANAGIDQSNVPDGNVLLLPEDIDKSAALLQERLCTLLDAHVGVIISDSVGRAWRNGTVGHALGVAGMTSLLDLRGSPDLYGRELRVSETALADNLAAAASVLMGEAQEARPVVLIRGLSGIREPQQNGRTLLRDKSRDLFR